MTSTVLMLALAGLALAGGAPARHAEGSMEATARVAPRAPDRSARRERAGLARIKVFFKLDPRLTRGLYMGDRWVSPPTYAPGGQEGTTFTLEARAHGVDAMGRQVRINPRWISADPEMMTVSPSEGTEVKITVERAGQGRLQVTSQGVSRELAVKASYQANVIRVEVSQD